MERIVAAHERCFDEQALRVLVATSREVFGRS